MEQKKKKIIFIILAVAIPLIVIMIVSFFLSKNFQPDSTSGISEKQKTTQHASYELIKSPQKEDSKKLDSSKMESAEVAKVPPKKQKEPELPDVYWSELNKHLLALEQERAAIMTMVIPKSSLPQASHNIDLTIATSIPKKIIQEKPKTPIKVSSPVEMSWAVVGNQLVELEQLRKNTINSLNVKVTPKK